jgi:hypothetical protein
MTGTAYLLTLTENDVTTIAIAGNRYCWSDALCFLVAGDNVMTWGEARKIRDAIERDMVTGRNAYPTLSPTSTLCTKLHNLYQSII